MELFEISFLFYYNDGKMIGSIFLLASFSLVFGIIFLNLFVVNYFKIFSTSSVQIIMSSCYRFFLKIFRENLNATRALRFYPLLLIIFLIIFFFNFLGLFFYDISITGHLIVTFFFSFVIFFSFFFIALFNFDISYLLKFIEKDIFLVLKVLLFFIEIISFFIRPCSLSIRLFTNMLSGHILSHIFSAFAVYILHNYSYLISISVILCISIFFLELFISFIQAYVFFVLLVIYLKDMYLLHD
jgi:F-type H+-transporting ATPase subunit a